jgi:hypothetical protein
MQSISSVANFPSEEGDVGSFDAFGSAKQREVLSRLFAFFLRVFLLMKRRMHETLDLANEPKYPSAVRRFSIPEKHQTPNGSQPKRVLDFGSTFTTR